MLTATKTWYCDCGCNEKIKAGEKFEVDCGTFYKDGHRDAKLQLRVATKPKIVLRKREVV